VLPADHLHINQSSHLGLDKNSVSMADFSLDRISVSMAADGKN
jgi:hypothetical protein